jgi:hypothetical protein
MERARQMRRDLITVAVVAVLLGAMLLISSNAASAQTATEDQYSSDTSASASASATASASPTSDPYSNGSGGGTAGPTTPAPVDNTQDPSGTQATADTLQSLLQATAFQIALQGIGLGHPPAVPGASTIGGSSFLDPDHWRQQPLGGSLGQAVIDMASHGLPGPLVYDSCETQNTDGFDQTGEGYDHDCATSGAWE